MVKLIRHFFFCVVGLCMACTAFAQTTTKVYTTDTPAQFCTPEEALKDFIEKRYAGSGTIARQSTYKIDSIVVNVPFGGKFTVTPPSWMGQPSSDGQTITEVTVAAGSSGCGTTPPEDKCKGNEGQTGVTNWTMGYQRSPSINSKEPFIAPNNPTNKKACVDQCKVALDVSTPCPGCRAYVSQHANAQGLYRVSTEFVSRQTGELCVPGPDDAPVQPSDSVDAKCPGYVGEVNGIKGCYGTADKPVTTQPNIVPSNFEQLPGNPAAGPLSGPPTPGSMATPTVGTGGSAGGPSGAATVGGSGSSAGVGSGSGTSVSSQGNGSGRVGTQAGTEQQACGAPGQPVCAVQVDEKDVKKEGDWTAAAKALEDQEKDSKSAFDRAHSIQQPGWTFSFQLPTGCAPFDTGIRGFSMNPCKYQSTIHDLMSMIWAAVTLFCIIGMVGRTIRES